jgi:hypothetical protein
MGTSAQVNALKTRAFSTSMTKIIVPNNIISHNRVWDSRPVSMFSIFFKDNVGEWVGVSNTCVQKG